MEEDAEQLAQRADEADASLKVGHPILRVYQNAQPRRITFVL